MGLLNFHEVSKYYRQRQILNEVSFSVERGERLALIGPNGGGKTTLVRIAMGIETADHGRASIARSVKAGFLTQDLSTLADDATALHYGEITRLEAKMRALEHQMAHPDGDVSALMVEYTRVSGLYEARDGYNVERRLKEILSGLGLRKEAFDTPLNLLSSGERMRAALARILLGEPDLLVLDEPTNHLDISALQWLEDYLMNFSGGVMVISHDRYFLDRVSTRIVELSGGTVLVHHGNYTSFLNQRAIRTEYLQDEKERLDREIRLESELARRLRATAHITQAQSREKRIGRLAEERQALNQAQRQGHLDKISAPGLNLRQDTHQSAEIAEARHARKQYGERVLFRNVNFLIRGGEHVAIVGPNGCGKTTLLRILLNQEALSEGTMRVGLWVKVGLLDQNAEFPDERRTMLEEVFAVREMEDGEIRRLLARVGFYGDEVVKRIGVLSGGERVRLKLALLLVTEPQCLILDEPTNHLDLPAREAVERAVAEFKGTVIAVSHDRYFLNRCVTRIQAFEGEAIRSYNGNWDAYQAALAARNAPTPIATVAGKAGSTPTLEEQIHSLESRKRAMELNGALNASAKNQREYKRLTERIEGLYARWVTE